MLKITSIAVIGALAFAPAAIAGGHTANDRAKSMSEFLKGNKGAARIASTLGKSGTFAGTPKGGWGNIGSATVTATNTPVSPKNPKGIDLTPAGE